MGVDTSSHYDYEHIPDDPKFISQPPRTTDYNVVILKLPRSLKRKPIMHELIENGLIEESQLPVRYEDVDVLKFDNEHNARKVVFYLNSNYGDIADLAYVPVSNLYLKDQGEARGHLATIKDAEAKEPNDIFKAYEKKRTDRNGFAVYEAVDVESRVKHLRPRIQKKSKKNYENHLKKRAADVSQARVRKNEFGETEVMYGGKHRNEGDDFQAKMERGFAGGMVQEGRVVDQRKAVELDFTRKSRDLRKVAAKAGREILKDQFLRDFRVELIACKKRKWQEFRTRRMYSMQGEKMLERTKMKQRYDQNSQRKQESATKSVWSSRSW